MTRWLRASRYRRHWHRGDEGDEGHGGQGRYVANWRAKVTKACR